jgi:hypothetical protein
VSLQRLERFSRDGTGSALWYAGDGRRLPPAHHLKEIPRMTRVSIRTFLLLALLVVAAPAVARAQDAPAGDIFAGGSYMSDDVGGDRAHLGGWHVAVTGNVNDWFALEADVAGHYGDHSHHSLMGGPRFTARGDRASAFVHALFGGVQAGDVGTVQMAFGGGVDVKVTDAVDIRVVQVDYMRLGFEDPSHNARVSAGLVFKF